MKLLPTARNESREIVTYFTPLKPLFEGLQTGDLADVDPLVPPLLHCICILWSSCITYRKGDRIVTLFKEISNHLISLVSKH